MKTFHQLTVFLIILLSFQINQSLAQINDLHKFDVWVQEKSDFHPIKRIEFAVLKDSTLFYSRKGIEQQLQFPQIANLYVREKKKIGKSALKGAGIGLLLGVTLALLDGPPAEGCFLCISQGDKIWLYGLALGSKGLGLGALIGSIKMKIPINPQNKRSKKKKRF